MGKAKLIAFVKTGEELIQYLLPEKFPWRRDAACAVAMAFSQVQCLDDSHVNWRSSESKPEFFYSEEQRLALEALAARGPDAFYEVLKKENIRDFLSELELKKILDTLETYDPGSEYIPRHGSSTAGSEGDRNSQGDEQDVAPSLEYWPQRSDRSIPQLDLGWPETIAYRGVTRATVYMQPPIEGQAHIKEVVRKMICQAQKVRRRRWAGGGCRMSQPGWIPESCSAGWSLSSAQAKASGPGIWVFPYSFRITNIQSSVFAEDSAVGLV